MRGGYIERSGVALWTSNKLYGDKQESELQFMGRKDSGCKTSGASPGDIDMSVQQLCILNKGISG